MFIQTDKTSGHVRMRNLCTKRHTWTKILFERKVKRKINGTIKNRDESWRIKTKKEKDLLIKHADVFTYIRAQRIRWIGHNIRMDKERTVKRITEWRPATVGRIGRSGLKWEEEVREDLRKIKIQNWSKMAMDTEAWKRIVKQVRGHNKK
jgi:hypothetical protein